MQKIISEEYSAILLQYHNNRDDWGISANVNDFTRDAILEYNPNSILDFGCGKGLISKIFKKLYPEKNIISFDPAFHSEDFLPEKVDMVYSKDVLEHVEPDYIDFVLQKHYNMMNKLCYHSISTRKAGAILPDGRNAHLIVQPAQWWREKFKNIGYKIEDERVNLKKHGYQVILTK